MKPWARVGRFGVDWSAARVDIGISRIGVGIEEWPCRPPRVGVMWILSLASRPHMAHGGSPLGHTKP